MLRLSGTLRIISETAISGEIGDGKIFTYRIDNAINIRTGETGNEAI